MRDISDDIMIAIESNDENKKKHESLFAEAEGEGTH